MEADPFPAQISLANVQVVCNKRPFLGIARWLFVPESCHLQNWFITIKTQLLVTITSIGSSSHRYFMDDLRDHQTVFSALIFDLKELYPLTGLVNILCVCEFTPKI